MRRPLLPIKARQSVILPIDAIIVDPEIQSRASFNEACAQEYADEIKVGKQFTPVTVFFDGERYWLADGFHRYRAYVLAGHQSIRVEIENGSRRDAILFSAGCNATHGLRRDWKDVRHTVTKLLMDKEWGSWSNQKIGETCNVSHTYVSNIRKELTSIGFKFDVRRETANGKVMDTSRIGKTLELKAKFKSANEQIEEQSPIIREIVDNSVFDPDEADELDEKIATVQEELRIMRKALRSKQMELLSLEAKRQCMISIAV